MSGQIDPYWADFERRRRFRLALATIVWFALVVCALAALCISALWFQALAYKLIAWAV